MRGYQLTIRFTSNPNDKQSYLVQVYKQPFHRWLIARIYHWYDTNVFKIPGFRALERWHHRRFGKGDWTFLPISVRQDIKCAFLDRQDKVIVAEFEVDEATYQRMR